MKLLRDIHATWYVCFYRYGAQNWSAGVNDWKGIGGIALMDWILILGMDAAASLGMQKHFLWVLSRWEYNAIFAAIFVVNYCWIRFGNRGAIWTHRFAAMPSDLRIRRYAFSFGIVALAILLLVLAPKGVR